MACGKKGGGKKGTIKQKPKPKSKGSNKKCK